MLTQSAPASSEGPHPGIGTWSGCHVSWEGWRLPEDPTVQPTPQAFSESLKLLVLPFAVNISRYKAVPRNMVIYIFCMYFLNIKSKCNLHRLKSKSH